VTAPAGSYAARLRAALEPLGIDIADDELPLIELIHDVITPGYDLLLTADLGRFPHEPVDPSRAPEPR
jgi:hypothetical protein